MNLPPIEYFYGRTPLKEWISRCKPFVPRTQEPPIGWIEIPNTDLLFFKEMYEEHDRWFKEQMNKYFRIKPNEI